jgi:uncharacterized RDD family membrane protein YckC
MDKQLRPSIFKRLIALILDFIVLGIIGYISAIFFEDFYVSLGKYGTLIGSTVTIIYFSILQSKIGKGQTLGKKTIGAKVTNLSGEYLTVGNSFLRSFITFFPIMNVAIFSGGKAMLLVVMLLLLATFSSIYLIFINKSRRCLHDILISSVVLNQNVSEFQINELSDRSTKKIIPIGVVALLMIAGGLYQTFTENTLSQLLAAKERIESYSGVITVDEVKSGTTTYNSSNQPSKTYSSVKITVRVDDENEVSSMNSRYFDEFYKIIKTEIPESQTVDVVTITLYYGFNIGIATKTKSVTKTFEN